MARKPNIFSLRLLFKTPLRAIATVLVAAWLVSLVSPDAGYAFVMIACAFTGLALICGWRPFKKKKA